VSALGHYLEEEGVATAGISLIRPQTENTKPPRALWVPFELGRPFGPPSNPGFQRRVLLAALRMLEHGNGPVVIEDFAEDDPRAQPDPAWHPPVTPAVAGAHAMDADALAQRLKGEITRLQDAHWRWVDQYSRTTVGISGLAIPEAGRYVAEWLRSRTPPSPREGYSAPLLMRFAVDDVKAYCLEAAGAGSTRPSSRQLGDWFWNESATGAALHALRETCLASEDERVKLIAGNFIVPAARVRAAG
jgi:hypothetical protein